MSDIENQEQDIDQEDEPESKDPSSVKVSSEIRFEFANTELLEIFFTSFQPEMGSLPSKRTKYTLQKEYSPKPAAVFSIQCDDLIAFGHL